MRSRRILVLGFSLAALGALSAGAQTNADVNAGLQFNFAPPGARSLAMGGAFSGLADDATAAYTNPAGLVRLTRPEVSVEGRKWDYSTKYPSGGSLAKPELKTSDSSTQGISFLSVVYPVKSWSFALFRHELSSFDAKLNATGIDLNGDTIADTDKRDARLRLDIAGIGGAASFRFSEAFSLGATLAYYSYDSSFESVQSETPKPNEPIDRRVNIQRGKGDDQDYGGSVGALWAKGQWSAGLVYRRSPELEGNSSFTCGRPPCATVPPGGRTRFKVPDVLSFGLGFQTTSRLTLGFEYDRVKYSQISDHLTNLLSGGEKTKDFRIDDANEFHLGAELRFPLAAEASLFVRAGGWLDPDHTLRYSGGDTRFQARFGTEKDREDDHHYSAGLGFAYGQAFQVDAAADLADRLDTYSLSAVYRF